MTQDTLKQVSVASPCSVDWQQMSGTDQVRFCDQCQLNVYNLSAMTSEEAQALVSQAEGKRCVRFYRRHDGTMLTQDCPKGFRAASRRWLKIAGVVIAGVMTGWLGLGQSAHAESSPTLSPTHNWGPDLPGNHAIMGELVAPQQPPYKEPPTVIPARPSEPPIKVTPQQPQYPKDPAHKSETLQPFVRFLACQNPDASTESKMTTMALGEEGGHSAPDKDAKITTMAVGEEGGGDDTVPPSLTNVGSEDGQQPPHDKPFTTMALGEEGGSSQ